MKFRYMLFPFAWLYGLALRIRNFLYDTGVFSITGFEYPIISVGNLSVGGTGKTPHIEYLIRLLQPAFSLATLSRGYGRKSKGFQVVKANMHVDRTGDEPLQYKKKFPEVKVVVGEKRVKAMMRLLATYPNVNTVLLDDAYQHRAIKPGLSILLTDYKSLFTRDYLLPVGSLRDAKRNKKRANIILVTKTPPDVSEEETKRIALEIKPQPQQIVFFTTIRYGRLIPAESTFPELTTDDLGNCRVLAFSGLAKSGGFVTYLKKRSAAFSHLRFRDHHLYTSHDLEHIKKKFSQLDDGKKIIVTTEKDWMRIVNEPIRKLFDGVPVYTIEIFVDFIYGREKEIFDQKIISYVEKNQPNRIFNRKQDRI